MASVREQLRETLIAALAQAREVGVLQVESIPAFDVSVPPEQKFGDFSSNVALMLAKEAKLPPREVAQRLVHQLMGNGEGSTLLEKVDIAGPGFLNFYLKPAWLYEVLRAIHAEGDRFGCSDLGHGLKLQVEFVSANPTGPLSVPHGRGAAIGDSLARLLEATGYDVSREFYINDTGSQMERYGRSLAARYLELLGDESARMPEDGYQGEYVVDQARAILERDGDKYQNLSDEERLETFTRLGREANITQQRATLERFGVVFDEWVSEKSLHDSGQVADVIKELKAAGHAYENEGALWLRASAFGDDKDRPLVRSNGQPTYIAADLAYHRDKFERGFERVIDIWGPDHHGYIARTKAGVRALGYPDEALEVLIFQHVTLVLEGRAVKGSKRAGQIILLDEVMDEVGIDASRFFFLMRGANSPLEFDLELATKQERENPVYYVQYAHARTCSILREAEKRGVALADPQTTDLTPLKHPLEIALIRKLAEFPEEVATAAEEQAPHRMTRFAQDLAAIFHGFYRDCHVLNASPDVAAARMVLANAAGTVFRNVLHLIGVSAPEAMQRDDES